MTASTTSSQGELAGHGWLWYHAKRPRHFSVGIEHAGSFLCTHFTWPIAGRSLIVRWGLCGRLFFGRRTHELGFALPRARDALALQRRWLGRFVEFDRYAANCFTWGLDVLRAGGLDDVPEHLEAAPRWLAQRLRESGDWDDSIGRDLQNLAAYIRWARRGYQHRSSTS